MTRSEWIRICADRFIEAGCSEFASKDCAISEFMYRCKDEPLEDSPELPSDRWPDPKSAADDAMNEWENDEP